MPVVTGVDALVADDADTLATARHDGSGVAPQSRHTRAIESQTPDMPQPIPFRTTAYAALAALALLLGGCASTPEHHPAEEGDEPTYVPPEAPPAAEPTAPTEESTEEPVIVEPEEPKTPPPPPPKGGPGKVTGALGEVIVQARPRDRHEVIRDLVAEAKALLRDVKLQYAFTGSGRREKLRGRPVAFALWSEKSAKWIVAHIEIPRPPIRWKPGDRPLNALVRTPGITARHVKGTGAERLMFEFWRGDEPLKVYGRKFPVFDNDLLKKKRWRAVAETAKPIVYLPFTEDTLDPSFIEGGRDFLLATARKAIDELRAAKAPSRAFPGELLADVVPPEVITTLAVIEQTDDADYVTKKSEAFNEVLSQYGLKRDEAYRYSVSRAAAIGPMQFTNRRGNGTYALVVRSCPAARIDPVFERGATDLLNAMKAAICLFDIELWQMDADIREAYRANKHVLGIFPVAAYNGGPRNVTKLYRVIDRMGLRLADLRAPGDAPKDELVACPCLWAAAGEAVKPVSIPKYNNENRWYVEKYQNILGSFAAGAPTKVNAAP
jgi:hypothetical protein